jgi:hypothetical protein
MTCLGDSDNNEMWWNMMEGQLWRNPGCLRLSCDFQSPRSLAPWRRPWKSSQRKRNWKRKPPAPNRTAMTGYDGLWGAVTGLMPSDCTGQGEILTWEVLEQPNCKVDLMILMFDMSSECVNLIGMEMLWVHSGTWRTVLVPGCQGPKSDSSPVFAGASRDPSDPGSISGDAFLSSKFSYVFFVPRYFAFKDIQSISK